MLNSSQSSLVFYLSLTFFHKDLLFFLYSFFAFFVLAYLFMILMCTHTFLFYLMDGILHYDLLRRSNNSCIGQMKVSQVWLLFPLNISLPDIEYFVYFLAHQDITDSVCSCPAPVPKIPISLRNHYSFEHGEIKEVGVRHAHGFLDIIVFQLFQPIKVENTRNRHRNKHLQPHIREF